MVGWTQSGYLDAGTWDHFRSKLDQAALPTNLKTLRLTAPSGGPHLLQIGSTVNKIFLVKGY